MAEHMELTAGLSRTADLENALSDLLDLIDNNYLVISPALDTDDATYTQDMVDRAVAVFDAAGEEGVEFDEV